LGASLDAIIGKDYIIDIYIKTHGSPPSKSTLGAGSAPLPVYDLDGAGSEFQHGTGGWMKVPGPTGSPTPITVHGGEMMNVVPAGQSGGGGGVNWYGDAIFIDSEEAMNFVASMASKNAQNAASVRAGAGYIGP
jgi:hypothetical protein